MVLHLPGLIVLSVLSGALFVGFTMYWIFGPIKGFSRHGVLLAALSALWFAASQLHYMNNDPCTTCRGDGIPVWWARGPLVAVGMAILTTHYGVFSNVSYGTYFVLAFKALLLGIAYTMSLLGNGTRQTGYWFVAAALVGVCLAAIKFRLNNLNKAGYYYGALVMGSVAGAVTGISYLMGPQLLDAMSEPIEFTIFSIGTAFLFLGVPVLLVIFYEPEGDESLFSKGRKAAGRTMLDACERIPK
jgi:hypothetical protein